MRRLSIVITIATMILSLSNVFAEVYKIETTNEGYPWSVYKATCPICNTENKMNTHSRFDSTYCKHHTDTVKYFYFDRTDEEKKDEEIKSLKDENKSLREKLHNNNNNNNSFVIERIKL